MAKTLRDKAGKYAGSVGDGKTSVPTSSPVKASPTPLEAAESLPKTVDLDTAHSKLRAAETAPVAPHMSLDEKRRARAREQGLVTPVTCKRCRGTGNVTARRAHYGVTGLCFKCDGLGLEEGDPAQIRANRAAAKEAKRIAEEKQAIRGAAYQRMRDELPSFVPFRDEETTPGFHTVQGGLWALEELEPERIDAAYVSINSGHSRVYLMLHEYFKANAAEVHARVEARRHEWM